MIKNTKIWVNIAFWYYKARLDCLRKNIVSIQSIETANTKIIIDSNVKFDIDLNVQINQHHLENPFDLTWKHKNYLQDFLDSDFTHFIYNEDDHIITNDNIKYWIYNIDKLKDSGFLHGFIRVEYKKDNPYAIDHCIKPRILKTLYIDDLQYISLRQPYQGIMIMDKDMVIEHINSPCYTINGISKKLRYRESANSDYAYFNVPTGFKHRLLTNFDDPNSCLIHHCTNTYINQKKQIHEYVTIPHLQTDRLDT